MHDLLWIGISIAMEVWLLLVLGVLIFHFWHYYDKQVRVKECRGPLGFPLVSNLFTMLRFAQDDLFSTSFVEGYFCRFHSKSVRLFRFLYRGELLFTKDPKVVSHILQSHFERWVKGAPQREIFHELFGSGIINSDLPLWKSLRESAKPLFHWTNIETSMTLTFVKHSNFLLEFITSCPPCASDKSSYQVEVSDMFPRFTLDAFMEIGFGLKQFRALKRDEKSEVLLNADRYVSRKVGERFLNPFWKWTEKWDKQLVASFRYYNSFTYSIIDRLFREQDEDEEYEKATASYLPRKADVASRYIYFLNCDTSHNITTPQARRAFVKDNTVSFLSAGKDNTALLLQWCCYCLSLNLRVQEKLRKILLENFPLEEQDTKISYQSILGVPYLKIVIDETLRLYPPLPTNARYCIKDDTLPIGPHGLQVKKGTQISYLIYLMNRDKEVWGEDVEEFKPERFEKVDRHRHPYQFIPFNSGPRVCIGQNMAYLEAGMVLVKILTRFRMQPPTDKTLPPVVPKSRLTLFPKYGITLNFTPLQLS